jgi:hypothetical protein
VYITVLTIGWLSANSRLSADSEPIPIGSRLELFVDDYLIDRLAGVEFRMHHPVARETVWSESNQTSGKWWGGANRSVSVFKDGQIYRMYYRDFARVTNGWTIKGGVGDEDIGCCYAESTDGIHWKRVPINRYQTEDLKVNNIIFAGTGATGFAVFKDSNPHCPPDARYKSIGRVMFRAGADPAPPKRDKTGYDWLPQIGILAFKSPDGLHWKVMQTKRIIKKGEFDSHNVAFWDGARQRYVSFFRIWMPDGTRIRSVATLTSKDFLNWSDPPSWLKYRRATTGLATKKAHPTHLYDNNIMPYYRAPHIIMGFPMRMIGGRVRVKDNPLKEETAVNDTGFMTSRDGLHFRRWREGFIRPGPHLGRWWNENNCIAWGMLETKSHIEGAPPELSFFANEYYADPRRSNLRRYTLRLDGFVSLHADETGEVVTRPLVFNGKELTMNFATSGIGSVRAELQDANGKPIQGFTLKDSREIFGDSINEVVTWKGNSNLQELAVRPIRIRFVMEDADIWSIRFR